MGTTKGVLSEITKISEGQPNVLDAKGILIATFSSIANVGELTEWFIENNRNFLLFELNEKNSGFNISKIDIHEGLFGFLKSLDTDEMDKMFTQGLEVESTVVESKSKPLRDSLTENKLDREEIEKMGTKDKEKLLDELIESGLENLSIKDKELLPLLTK